MEKGQKTKPLLQWHPAFYAGIRIEFSEEADKLCFENEEKDMCEALRELFGDELTTAIAAGIEEQLPRVVEERVAERVAEVRQEGINILIADNIEEGFSMDKILGKLEKRFGLTASEARGYLKQFTAG